MPDIVVILNPAAHSERARGTWERIEAFPGARVQLTAARGDARRQAREAAESGAAVVVAAGGDGTVNEVVNGIVGTETALGVLPVGTMNVFSHELGIPADLAAAWEVIVNGNTREIDLAMAGSQYFVQLAGVGFDAQVVEATSWNFKKNFGPLSYLVSAATIAAKEPPRILVEHESGVREGSFVLVGNGRFYGAPIEVFRDARLDDGLLDLLILKSFGYLDLVRLLAGVATGLHTELDEVEYMQVQEVRIRSEQQVPVEVDGELAGELPLTFKIAKERLRVVVR